MQSQGYKGVHSQEFLGLILYKSYLESTDSSDRQTAFLLILSSLCYRCHHEVLFD